MENASKALIIAAGVILGVLILSVAVALFTMFGGSSKEIVDRMDQAKLTEYNNNFLKFHGSEEVTAYDIVTMANFAKYNNEIAGVTEASDLSDYVRIEVTFIDKETGRKKTIDNFEKQSQSYYSNFIRNNATKINNDKTVELKNFECTVSQNSITHKVNLVVIKEEI